ncbi:hypothetical protein [Oceanithermus sp.]|uniref:hypothetical protein n=1 Tax=Oceanithermus sp. TaxID=2268145 RepID=UPI0025D2B24E|nr:hypothetical protein [Oceanithermus sp.]
MDSTSWSALVLAVFALAFLGVAARALACREARCTRTLGIVLFLLVVALLAIVTAPIATGRFDPTTLPVWVTKGLGSFLGLSAAAAAFAYLVALVRNEESA